MFSHGTIKGLREGSVTEGARRYAHGASDHLLSGEISGLRICSALIANG